MPKTAGVAFTSTLAEGIAPERRLLQVRNYRLLLPVLDSLPDLDLLAGHLPLAIAPLLRRPSRTITFLRDPLERTLSAFRHIERSPHHNSHRLLVEEAPSLGEALRHPILRFHFLSPYTRMLGADGAAIAAAHPRGPAALAEALASLQLDVEPTVETLHRALAAVNALDLIGLTEDMQLDGPRCLAVLRQRPDAWVPRLNAAPTAALAKDLPVGLRQEMAAALRDDLLVWEAARDRVAQDRRQARS